jgi:hypothetical protein
LQEDPDREIKNPTMDDIRERYNAQMKNINRKLEK